MIKQIRALATVACGTGVDDQGNAPGLDEAESYRQARHHRPDDEADSVIALRGACQHLYVDDTRAVDKP